MKTTRNTLIKGVAILVALTLLFVIPVQAKSGITLASINNNSNTGERISAMFDYLIGQGFTVEAASGVIGNIAQESRFNPAVVSSSGYYGLCQWNTSAGGGYWWYAVQDWMSTNGYEWSSFEGQVKAIVECPSRGQLSDGWLAELKSLKNVEQAVELFAVFYEGCCGGSTVTQYYMAGSYYQDLDVRKSEAWVAYNMYKNQSTDYTGCKPYA